MKVEYDYKMGGIKFENNQQDEAARIIHTQILMGEDASFKEIKRAIEIIFNEFKQRTN